MQACVEQKRSGSSYVGGYSSRISAYFDVSRLTVIDTQILRWRDFDSHMPACFRSNAFWGLINCVLHGRGAWLLHSLPLQMKVS